MNLEEILHTFNSQPSKMFPVSVTRAMDFGGSRTICDWLCERGHFESYKGCSSLFLISVEAQQILTNPKNLKTLETYLNI